MRAIRKLMSIGVALLTLSSAAPHLLASEAHKISQDTNGNAVSVWQTFTYSGTVVQANTFDGFNWGSPTTISSSNSATDPRVAVIANGSDISAIAIWTEINNENTVLMGAMMPYIGYGWTPPAQISLSGETVTNEHQISVNDNGNIIVTWASVDAKCNQYIRSSVSALNAFNSWDLPSTVSGP